MVFKRLFGPVHTFVFMQNTLSTKTLEEKTPFKTWFDRKPSLKILKDFCYVYYALNAYAKRGKR